LKTCPPAKSKPGGRVYLDLSLVLEILVNAIKVELEYACTPLFEFDLEPYSNYVLLTKVDRIEWQYSLQLKLIPK
jgi:hypothetical protein